MKLRRPKSPLCLKHPTGPLQDPGSLRGRARHHPRVVGKKEEGQTESTDPLDEIGRLDRCGRVHRARAHGGIICDDRDRAPSDEGQSGQDRGSIARLDLEERIPIHQPFEHRSHGIDPTGVGRNVGEDFLEAASTHILALPPSLGLATMAGEIAQVPTGHADRLRVVGRYVVRHSRLRDGHLGPTQLLLGDLLTGSRPNQWRSSGEERRLTRHDREIRERRSERAMPRGGPEHQTDHRNAAGEIRERQ